MEPSDGNMRQPNSFRNATIHLSLTCHYRYEAERESASGKPQSGSGLDLTRNRIGDSGAETLAGSSDERGVTWLRPNSCSVQLLKSSKHL